jgi:DNA polymerase III subunit delta
MIVKSFELSKIDSKNKKFFLLYGQNEGYKKQVLEEKFKKHYNENIYYYDENEILQNEEAFFNNIFSKSFFDNEKLIIINRTTDKIRDIIKEILEKKIDDVVFVLNSAVLEKKSKLRSLFEKEKETICVPFYEDNNQTLSGIVNQFFRNAKISISQQLINVIVERCRGDRINLKNELEKIQNFSKNKKKINIEDLLKLTNLAENYSVSELVDNCLAKNKKKTVNILNENNYSLEDCILIIRTFLMKSKKLLKLHSNISNAGDIDKAISSFKPPIFWKDKDITKLQIKNWSYNNVRDLVYKINEIELLIKKNSKCALNILSDFIVEQVTVVSN